LLRAQSSSSTCFGCVSQTNEKLVGTQSCCIISIKLKNTLEMGLDRFTGGKVCKEHLIHAGQPLYVCNNCDECMKERMTVWLRRVKGLLPKSQEICELTGARTILVTYLPDGGFAVFSSEGREEAVQLLNRAIPHIPLERMSEPLVDQYLPDSELTKRCYLQIKGQAKVISRYPTKSTNNNKSQSNVANAPPRIDIESTGCVEQFNACTFLPKRPMIVNSNNKARTYL
jgi:hypothetical protein